MAGDGDVTYRKPLYPNAFGVGLHGRQAFDAMR
jgi:hypothetical protein